MAKPTLSELLAKYQRQTVKGNVEENQKGKRIVGQTKTHYLTNYGAGSIPKGAAKELPTMEGVKQRAQAFANQRDTKNKAWSNLKDAVGQMTQPFQPLSVMLAQSAAPPAPVATSVNMPAPENLGGMSDLDYEMALNQAIDGIVDTVLTENLMNGRAMI